MWPIVWFVIAGAWLFFYIRSRRLARVTDRGEVAILKPLSITYLVLAIAAALSGAWLLAASSAFALLVNGAIGASLHRERTAGELAEGTIQHMEEGPLAEVVPGESHQLARVILLAAGIASVVVLAALLRSALRWYLALPAAALAGYLLMIVWLFLAAYHRKKR